MGIYGLCQEKPKMTPARRPIFAAAAGAGYPFLDSKSFMKSIRASTAARLVAL